MKRTYLVIALFLLAPALAISQTHNEPFGKGTSAQCLGVRNNAGATTLNDTNLAWGAMAVDATGQLFTATSGNANSAQKAEDAGSASGDYVTPMGAVRADQVPTGSTNNDADWINLFVNTDGGLYTQNIAGRSGGCNHFGLNSAASNNATSVDITYRSLYSLLACNTNAAIRYVKLYNKSSAPAPATDSALLRGRYMIPPTACLNIVYAVPMAFSSGLAYATVTGVSDTDNTSVGANDILLTGCYK